MDIKGTFKGLLLSILGTTLILSLFFIGYGLVFNLISSDRNQIKEIFSKSSLYEKLPEAVYDNAVDNKNSQSFVPLKDPEVRKLALEVFTPSVAQKNIENSIDGTYDWLEGKTDQPMFTLDVTGAKNLFADKLGAYAKEKTKSLPDCSIEQLQALRSSKEFNIFKAKCAPAFLSPSLIDNQTAAAVKKSDEILGDGTLKASELKNSNGKPLFKNLNKLPDTYSATRLVPLMLIVFALGLMFTIFKLSKSRYLGLKRISRLLVASGILTLVVPVSFMIAARTILGRLDDKPEIRDIGLSMLNQYFNQASKIYYFYGLFLIIIGIGIYVFAKKHAWANKNSKEL